jgi:hypothetical protein
MLVDNKTFSMTLRAYFILLLFTIPFIIQILQITNLLGVLVVLVFGSVARAISYLGWDVETWTGLLLIIIAFKREGIVIPGLISSEQQIDLLLSAEMHL